MKKTLLSVVFVLSFIMQLQSQTVSYWTEVQTSKVSKLARKNASEKKEGEKYFQLNAAVLQQKLAAVTGKTVKPAAMEITVPNAKGTMESYKVIESSNFDPELQAKFPSIRAYVGQGISDKTATIHFSLSPLGFQSVVFRGENATEFIEGYDKSAAAYVVFDSNKSISGKAGFKCTTPEAKVSSSSKKSTNRTTSSAQSYKTLRLALSCNGEYAQHFGGTVEGALAGMNASITRINGIFEKDFAVHMNLIANNEQLIYLDATTDPYSDAVDGTQNDLWNKEVQNTLSSTIGNAAYDIGHLYCKTGGGGNAGCIGCICVDDDVTNLTDINKGGGYTSPESDTAAPEGDVFDFDFAAHEFGHQLGANHTFSYNFEESVAQIEPGSGCTTMGYAGVTDWDVQPHNMRNFAYVSIKQVQENLATKTCPISMSTTNVAPVVNAGGDYAIPKGTAFILTGTGTDADASDVLTYSWEQNDVSTDDTKQANSMTYDTKVEGPTFRIQEPSLSPVRYMPKLTSVLAGKLGRMINDAKDVEFESVSNVARDLNFTFTARDNHPGEGQTKTAAMKVSVVTSAGPFVVTSQNVDGQTFSGGSSQTISWDVNNTASLDGSSMVSIMMSIDGGTTFTTTLASSVANSGTAVVTLPNVNATNCRIMVKPTANIYYAVNAKSFEITNTLSTVANALDQFALYPNTNHGTFTVNFGSKNSDDTLITVSDVLGKQVYSQRFKNNTASFSERIELSTVQNGFYFVTVQNGKNKEVRKILVN
ncbi:hypothetical protein FFWV33_07160 [Flavobacterium faecale]|uniref:Secretion system C-terminal sorting domain-containing protein n=1 Tax=Flavobacterium faecale TaxID=1355330 RepID=A0A2S1LC38_9FLAO|nr:zinc-dependent metalloprotease [Flavobacterium faecale]AWG21323.1 hypothetical protein FFWV33_07160 [Flavobacterium faecale]